ncbi:DUF4197 domain-containing protein [Ferruginibacter profundus]
MKKVYLMVLVAGCFLLNSCGGVKNLFTAQDAENAIREMLSIGTTSGGNLLGKKGMISKETLMSALFPEELKPVLNTLETLGLSKEVSRFTTTLGTAAEQTAEKSVPIFLSGIKRMNIKDAVGIVKNGGTAATDYLRKTIGDTLRNAITPVMNGALNEYKLTGEWNKVIAPAQLFAGDKLNLNLGNLMSGLVANLMFNKIAEKETEVRTNAQARTSSLLQKVFAATVKN